MPRADATARAYLVQAWMPVRVTLEPTQGEVLAIRHLSQGRTITLTREDTNRDAHDAGGQWWRDGVVRLFDRGLLAPRTVLPDRVEWDWADTNAELTARRLTRNDEHLPWTWLVPDRHVAAAPRLAELVAMLAWDMRFQGTGVMDVDATDPNRVHIYEERLYGVTKNWDITGWSPRTPSVFDWDPLHRFAATVEPSKRGWYGPPRFPDHLRVAVLHTLLARAHDLFDEPRLRVNLTTWTITRYGQHPVSWHERFPADAKDALAFLDAPTFDTPEAFLRWAHAGALQVSVPCGTGPAAGATTTLRIEPSTGEVTAMAEGDEGVEAAMAAEHLLLGLTGTDCACAQAHRTLSWANHAPTHEEATRTSQQIATERDWMTRAHAIAIVVRGYASLKRQYTLFD